MLDKWFKFINDRLGSYAAATTAQRAQVEEEMARGQARQHAGREFENAEGFTTPLPKAFENAQNVYARARRDFEASGGAEVFMLFVGMLVAREKRDDAWTALKRYEEAEAERAVTGVHRYVKPYYADMFKRGVEPRQLVKVREETKAIVADLIQWDGNDPTMTNPDNPMRKIFEIYAGRQVLEPGQLGDKSRSVAGKPVVRQRETDPVHYRFDLLVRGRSPSTLDGEESGETTDTVDALVDTGPMVIDEIDTTTVLSDGDDSLTPRGVDTGAGEPEPSVTVAAMKDEAEADEYALPARFTADDVKRIRTAAAQFLADDPDWDYELQAAAAWFHGGLTTQEVIERVATTRDDARSTPFRYFVDAARKDGLAAGKGAYHAATVRRVMHQIVTAPEFAQARVNLRLE